MDLDKFEFIVVIIITAAAILFTAMFSIATMNEGFKYYLEA